MINFRNGIYETNSSSSHSIVVSSLYRGYDYDLPIDENGILKVEFGEFGWGPDILRNPIDKISYYITDNSNLGYNSDITWEEGISKIKERQEIKDLEAIIKKHCPNFKELEFRENNNYFKFGFVDHQSCGTSHDSDLEELIFNKSVIILIDNDNGYNFEDYYEPSEYEKGGRPHKDIEDLWVLDNI